ncbi:thrombospondin type-1 domain-containing protein 4-like [Entelurus aequoreus]|uniref:thrombospondin type-1 domain-containing protein 4-like n=1 Tax=Entelurus aequoreus TaxID=161455 RepID=UPI002B1E80A9|nr:thrombospondin type-1 domain-containing protein 4-like [Entelurus aequoreus]
MPGVRRCIIRNLPFLLLLCWEPVRCQRTTDHRKVPQRAAQDFRADLGGPQGSWGTWGSWSACSLTCGSGVQERSRPCLRVYMPRVPPLQQGVVISALKPSVSVYRDTEKSSEGDGHEIVTPPGGHRRINPILPGRYGYGKPPLESDTGHPASGGVQRSIRHKRSTSSQRFGLGSHHHLHSRAQTQPMWAPLYQQGSARHGPGPQQQNTERPYDPLPTSSCTGEHTHHRLCSSNACAASSKHIRAVQCSSFNKQPFMGRLYDWEPFNEVGGGQHCQLNCRAAGFRFYVRLSDKVIDGTPCGLNDSSSVCVEGQCMSPGCDGYLGSGRVMDTCGVCGGDNATCRLVSGVFQHSLSKIGYHKITEIPSGATKINVTEMAKSRNYLALQSRSGRSIINGNWAIDRPGMFEGGGTMFTYRRPNEISSTAGESFLAEGPTDEILDVFVIFQQANPGVHYEYMVPSEGHGRQPNHTPEGNAVNEQEYHPAGAGRYPATVKPHRRERDYEWKMVGTSECSASCGKGSRYAVFHCVHRLNRVQVQDTLCDSNSKPTPQEEPCNLESCPAFWDIGEWSECSKMCGLGMQHRQVLCRQVYANHTLNVHTSRCSHLERPETAGTCQMKICSEWQIRSEWSACSVPCGLGQRSREVRCVSNVGDFVLDAECNMNLRPVDLENCDMGACAKSWFYTNWGAKCSTECGMGVRTRGILCLTNHISSLPLEGCGSERPPHTQVCNNGPCENAMEWFTGPWSQCSAECGAGSQQRAVVCLTSSPDGFAVAPQYECSSLERPLGQQSCNVRACGAKWYYTDWSACSKTCEGGFRVREVRCLTEDKQSGSSCDEQLKPAARGDCNPEPCVPQTDDHCKDQFFNCNVVVQARLCVYDYYKDACCASCSRHPHRQSVVHRGRS